MSKRNTPQKKDNRKPPPGGDSKNAPLLDPAASESTGGTVQQQQSANANRAVRGPLSNIRSRLLYGKGTTPPSRQIQIPPSLPPVQIPPSLPRFQNPPSLPQVQLPTSPLNNPRWEDAQAVVTTTTTSNTEWTDLNNRTVAEYFKSLSALHYAWITVVLGLMAAPIIIKAHAERLETVSSVGHPLAAVFAYVLNNSSHDKHSKKLDLLHTQIGDLILSLQFVEGFSDVQDLVVAFKDLKKQLDAWATWGQGIEQTLDLVREDVARLPQEMQAMYTGINTMFTQVIAMNTQLNSEFKVFRGQFDGLQDTVEENGHVLRTMQQSITELQQSNTTLQQRFQQSVTASEQRDAAMQQRFQRSVIASEQRDAALQQSITDSEQRDAALQQNVSGLQQDIKTLMGHFSLL
jgi:hypothetical protein